MALIKKDTKINLSPPIIKDYYSFFKYIKQEYQIADKRLEFFKKDLEASVINTFDKDFNVKHIDIEKCKFEKIQKKEGNYEIDDILDGGKDLVGQTTHEILCYFNEDDFNLLFNERRHNRKKVFIFYTLFTGTDEDYNLIYIITDKTYEIYNIKEIEDAIN